MRLPALLLAASLASVLASGCTTLDPDARPGRPLGPDTYRMDLSGMPAAPVPAGQAFNVTVHAEMGEGLATARHASDHIGAHFWNRSVADPTAELAGSAACSHRVGDLPGEHATTCTAPTAPGTYHVRAHARIIVNGTTHHWWGDEETFTVA